MRKALFVFFLLICNNAALVVSQNADGNRIALIIGNSHYLNGQVLKNPVNDANLMATTLQKLGFSVTKKLNVNKMQMDNAILSFSRKLSAANVALFFYAGHGIQVNGVNYLVPTDADLEDALSAQFQAVDVGKIVAQFEMYPKNINILILDACRNNPFRSWMRSLSDKGFKAIPAPSGTIIAFATSEGASASDGYGSNGLYTQELVKQIIIPQSIETVFKKTRISVEQLSSNTQSPQEWTKLKADFYFNPNLNKNGYSNTDSQSSTMAENNLFGSMILNPPVSGKLKIDNIEYQSVILGSVIRIGNLSIGEHIVEINGDEIWKKHIIITDEKPIEVGKPVKSVYVESNYENTKNKNSEFTDIRDGRLYKTIKIGDFIWMAENLNYQSDVSTSFESWCVNDDPENCKKFGRLYSWQTAKIICPAGWHLPDYEEWADLLGWLNNNNKDELFDKNGFNALYGGRRVYESKNFIFQEGYFGGKHACFWTSSLSNNGIDALLLEAKGGWLRSCRLIESTFYVGTKDSNNDGLSVRCVKDK
jgi:uncharacterized protein (TIGR02145 family)